jgi:hypothetical protein
MWQACLGSRQAQLEESTDEANRADTGGVSDHRRRKPGCRARRDGEDENRARGAHRAGDVLEDSQTELALDSRADELVVDAAFKRQTGTRKMTVVYNVTGCMLADTAPKPTTPLPTYPPKTDQIPDGAIKLARAPSIENGGKRYLVPLTVESSSISPGSYGGMVEIASPVMNPVRTPLTISRSEHRLWVPLGGEHSAPPPALRCSPRCGSSRETTCASATRCWGSQP